MNCIPGMTVMFVCVMAMCVAIVSLDSKLTEAEAQLSLCLQELE